MVEINAIKQYAVDMEQNVKTGKGLIVSGDVGVGKSFGLAALTYQWRVVATRDSTKYPSRDYIYITAPDFFDRIDIVGATRDEYRGNRWIDSFTKTPWLVINDLGKEYRGGKLEEQIPHKLGRVLRKRLEDKLPTFITTNLNAEGIRHVYGDSVRSALRESCRVVEVTGPDRRKQAFL